MTQRDPGLNLLKCIAVFLGYNGHVIQYVGAFF